MKKIKYILILLSILISTYTFSIEKEMSDNEYLAELLVSHGLYFDYENAASFIDDLTDEEIETLIDNLHGKSLSTVHGTGSGTLRGELIIMEFPPMQGKIEFGES